MEVSVSGQLLEEKKCFDLGDLDSKPQSRFSLGWNSRGLESQKKQTKKTKERRQEEKRQKLTPKPFRLGAGGSWGLRTGPGGPVTSCGGPDGPGSSWEGRSSWGG